MRERERGAKERERGVRKREREGEEIVIHTNIETLQQQAYFEFDYNHYPLWVTYPFRGREWVVMEHTHTHTHTHTQWLPHSHRFEYWMITEVVLKKEGWRDTQCRDQMSEEIE